MPSTGTGREAAAAGRAGPSASGRRPSCRRVMVLASARRSPASTASAGGGLAARSTSQSRISSLIIPARPSRWPSSGVKISTAAPRAAPDLPRPDDAPAPAEDPALARPGLLEQASQVLEVLHVAALVG